MCTTDAPSSYASDAALAISSGVTGTLNFVGSVRMPFNAALTTTLSPDNRENERIVRP